MTDKWEKVLNILTVIVLLSCLLNGAQKCVGSYQDYVEALSVSDGAELPYRQLFFEARFYRQVLLQSIETLSWLGLCVLVSRFFYLFLKRRIPMWAAEDSCRSDSEDGMKVLVRIVRESGGPEGPANDQRPSGEPACSG